MSATSATMMNVQSLSILMMYSLVGFHRSFSGSHLSINDLLPFARIDDAAIDHNGVDFFNVLYIGERVRVQQIKIRNLAFLHCPKLILQFEKRDGVCD